MRRIALILALLMCCACLAEGISCDTRFNGCAGLPVTWTVHDESRPVEWIVYKADEDTVVCKSDSSGSAFGFTPAKGGQYICVCRLENGDVLLSDEVFIVDALYMGVFEQDANAKTSDPIEWTVLAVKDGKALVTSKYILEHRSYFNPWWIKYKYTFWAYSYISDFSTNYWGSMPEDPSRLITINGRNGILWEDRKSRRSEEDLYESNMHIRWYLNHDFLEKTFTEAERARICLTHLTNPDNPESKVDGGPDTDDYIFFLSYTEVKAYMPDPADRKTKLTTSAKRLRPDITEPVYWLRTPGHTRVDAMIVYGSNGNMTYWGTDVGHSNVGVRPCMWISIGG